MNDDAAALYYRYTTARAWFRRGAFDEKAPLDEGIFINSASPPIVTYDAKDPDFLAALS